MPHHQPGNLEQTVQGLLTEKQFQSLGSPGGDEKVQSKTLDLSGVVLLGHPAPRALQFLALPYNGDVWPPSQRKPLLGGLTPQYLAQFLPHLTETGLTDSLNAADWFALQESQKQLFPSLFLSITFPPSLLPTHTEDASMSSPSSLSLRLYQP